MADNHDAHPTPPYKMIFGALIVFTLLSVAADAAKDLMPGAGTLAVVVLAIAAAKATCVMLYFMHLKFERNWKYVFLGPTFILAIGLPLALLPDIGVHYYEMDVPQDRLEDRAAAQVDSGTGESSSTPSH